MEEYSRRIAARGGRRIDMTRDSTTRSYNTVLPLSTLGRTVNNEYAKN
jgi:hypothetical protein